MSKGLVQRGNAWYLKRRVPLKFASVETRSEIWRSLKTDSRSVAVMKAEKVWLELIEGWEAKLAGKSDDAAERFKAAQAISDMRGFRFLSADQVAEAPLEDILARIEAARSSNGTPAHPVEAAALLGVVDEPKLMLSGLVDHAEKLAASDNRYKNANQMRKWRNPRKRAIANLIAAIGGDLAVVNLRAEHAKLHRRSWKARVNAGEVLAETANKDFNYISGMLSRFYDDLDIDEPPRPYLGVSLSDKFVKQAQKLEVPTEWIMERWFAAGALDGLNDEARDILLISIETGCRQSEIHDIPAASFHLSGEFPHLLIENVAPSDEAEGREIKNIPSMRKVPLVGVALAAARRHPSGFPRYRGSSSYSGTVNSYLRENDLLPPNVTIGGIRHTWETRLKKAGYATDDRGELMGHSRKAIRGRESYGDAMTLEERFEIVRGIAFPVPAHLA